MSVPKLNEEGSNNSVILIESLISELCALARQTTNGAAPWPRLIDWRERTHALIIASLGEEAGKEFSSLCMSFYENGHEPTFNEIAGRYCLALSLLKEWISNGEGLTSKVSTELLAMLNLSAPQPISAALTAKKFKPEKFIKVTLGVLATFLADVVTKMFF